MRIKVELSAIMLTTLMAVVATCPASAQKYGSTPPDPVHRDWTLAYDFDLREEFRLKRTPLIAYVPGNRAKTGLEISDCGTAQWVSARLEPDKTFDVESIPQLADTQHLLKPAFLFIPGTGRTWRVTLEGAYTAWHFDLPRDAAQKGTAARICPVDNASDVRCLNFSLRGFTAALKRVCDAERRKSDE